MVPLNVIEDRFRTGVPCVTVKLSHTNGFPPVLAEVLFGTFSSMFAYVRPLYDGKPVPSYRNVLPAWNCTSEFGDETAKGLLPPTWLYNDLYLKTTEL